MIAVTPTPSQPTPDVPFFTPRQDPPTGTALPEDGKNIAAAFRPLTIRGTTFINRIFVSPMCQYSCRDGFLTDYHVAHYGQFAIRGAALVTIEMTAVTPSGRNTPQDSGLYSDEHIAPLKRVADVIKSQGKQVAIQLGHAGRKASVQPPWIGLDVVADSDGGFAAEVKGPTEEGWNGNYAKPGALSVAEIKEIVEAYGKAAARAVKAGVRIIAVHGAHGYLIHSFASPATNTRGDEYGGTFENRVMFGLEIVKSIRANIPKDALLFWRISAVDWLEPGEGWEIEDTVRYAAMLRDAGVDLLDVSSGGTDRRQKVQLSPGYQIPFAEAVKRAVPGLYVSTVGWIRDGVMVNEIIEKEKADVVSIAREFLRDPNFVYRVAREVGQKVKWLDQYHRAPYGGANVESTTVISTEVEVHRDVIREHEKQVGNKYAN
ncbi:FMN-linked oxidoreductase [Saitoella complicata NRRL Y-17804]|uniref:NADH:flavin oxidoreductase/NADH oxidase N-terminal domain-containing protein n=1 Tax=Saitoella complicata (strain BCRC 22490 / CBS 7301 / JCM 7358 / NBRC 10748 / NRRL Y-17804) TaxID=698492 RepID=A0A0E9NH11_SAICN|nr:FMN-linked oxidoreductase [Saitoella complicata NRRL Y-17804]ODQ54020.1 FMN-linked oxidoreductase [Saitoella complicata NRRL Y-17804]GAO49098.1 hypothetical protein G7K_3256-t1 [Saitoella complicata NRRL Y-17804]